MKSETVLREIPGGVDLLDWFGRVPDFHDANVLDLNLASKGPSSIRIHTWEITDETDAQGYFVLDKHVVVTISLDEVSYVALNGFDLPGIVFSLDIIKVDDDYQFTWSASYGVEGSLRARHAYLYLTPGKP
jgi:hypothetical protein